MCECDRRGICCMLRMYNKENTSLDCFAILDLVYCVVINILLLYRHAKISECLIATLI